MTLIDLQWEVNKILMNTKLSREERQEVQNRINALITRFGNELITQLGVAFNAKT